MSTAFTNSTEFGTTEWLYALYTPSSHRVQARGTITLTRSIDLNAGRCTIGSWKTATYIPDQQRVCLGNTGGTKLNVMYIETTTGETWLRLYDVVSTGSVPSGTVITVQFDYMI